MKIALTSCFINGNPAFVDRCLPQQKPQILLEQKTHQGTAAEELGFGSLTQMQNDTTKFFKEALTSGGYT